MDPLIAGEQISYFLDPEEEDQIQVNYTCVVYPYDILNLVDVDSVCPTIPYAHPCFRIRVVSAERERLEPNPDLYSYDTTDFVRAAESSLENTISQVVGLHFYIPAHIRKSMITKILEVAKRESEKPPRNFANLICMAVTISFDTTYFNYEDDDEDDMEESMEDQNHRICPASKSSIENLERVKIGKGGGEEEGLSCSICLEDFQVDNEEGDKAIRMPCHHLFHSSCILNWLRSSHICPLCRFPLPPASNN